MENILNRDFAADRPGQKIVSNITYILMDEGCILHSDRRSQYCLLDYQALAKAYGFVSSMSQKESCWDNAPMESFWGKLKQEWLNDQRFRSREEAKSAVFEYIWIFYNCKCIHETNGYLTPEEYYE